MPRTSSKPAVARSVVSFSKQEVSDLIQDAAYKELCKGHSPGKLTFLKIERDNLFGYEVTYIIEPEGA